MSAERRKDGKHAGETEMVDSGGTRGAWELQEVSVGEVNSHGSTPDTGAKKSALSFSFGTSAYTIFSQKITYSDIRCLLRRIIFHEHLHIN